MAFQADLFGSSRTVYSVSRLNREARFVLNELFGTLWIEGEISNLTAPASGHLYFTLKDAEAQVRCALFRPQARLLPFKPRNGDQVLAKAEVGLYEPRGEFQLVVETLEPAGDGVLLRAFEALKQRLAAEGLFDPARKQPIPALPRCVGVVTSPTGAAVRDILAVLRRRFPAIPVIVFPVKVQGADAKAEIVRALQRAERLGRCDVLILARGGGSLEDLWAFNEEAVARAIHACPIPVISAVGHEIDFTIADFVADLRAATPSAAAEAASPDGAAWRERFERLQARLRLAARTRLTRAAGALGGFDQRLRRLHPERRLQTQAQRLDELAGRLARAWRHELARRGHRLEAQAGRLLAQRPETRLRWLAARLAQSDRRLRAALRQRLGTLARALAATSQALHAVSPLATLARGYSLTLGAEDGALLRSFRAAPPGSRIVTHLAEGRLISRVEDSFPETLAVAEPPARPIDIPSGDH